MSEITTMEQDWEDTFPFLKDGIGLEAPFLLMLLHARSKRHLESMLREWLPLNWHLSNDELIAMQDHWDEWYRGYRDAVSGGSSNHLFRTAVSWVCRRGSSLGGHYCKRLEAAWGSSGGKWWAIGKNRRPIFSKERMLPSDIFILCGESSCFTLVHRPDSDQAEYGVPEGWYALFHFGPSGLTEERTHQLLQLPKPWMTTGVRTNGLYVAYRLPEENLLDSLCEDYIIKEGTLEELQRQLNELGVPVSVNSFQD